MDLACNPKNFPAKKVPPLKYPNRMKGGHKAANTVKQQDSGFWL